MPHEKYVPKHRNTPTEPALKKGLRKSLTFSGVAVAATGVAVSSGIVMKDQAPAEAVGAALSAAQATHDSAARQDSVQADAAVHRAQPQDDRQVGTSRSAERSPIDPEKKEALTQESGGQVTRTEDLADQDPKAVARALMPKYGFSESEFGCLDALWMSESDWDPHADNPTSTAYGIPQALTGGTHDNLPADYMTNPVSQIKWGLGYIRDSYGSPCAAWDFKQSHMWY
ncbi:MAG TPA: lytic transglycosylase domain-containing protein [Nocardioidaceae bacterium]